MYRIKNQVSEYMKSLFKLYPLAAASLLIMSACGGKESSSSVESSDRVDPVRDSLEQALADQDSVIALMTELSDAMQQIKAMEGIAGNLSSGELTNQRQQLRNDMAAIQQSMLNNRQRLAALEERLSKSNSNNAKLKRAITSLRNQIEAQELTISGLRDELAAANIYIEELTQAKDSLAGTVAETEQAHEEALRANTELTNELNRGYYVIGSKKELKDHNIIETGFMKKAKVSPADYELNYFTAIDKREFKTLQLHSKKAEIMSGQPADSYTIVSDDNGMKTLNITNPERFWATSNYLVIKVD